MCAGAVPLRARLEPWHEDLAARPERIADWMAAHGSPLNLIEPAPMGRNAAELTQAASARGLDLRIFFARKANKALALVDEAMSLGLGVDVASEQELRQALERGVPAEDIVVTAAIKPRALLELCAKSGSVVVVDNVDELRLLSEVASPFPEPARIALRLAPTPHSGAAPTRFGMTARELAALDELSSGELSVTGVHFHLDGYSAEQRVAAIGEVAGRRRLPSRSWPRGRLPGHGRRDPHELPRVRRGVGRLLGRARARGARRPGRGHVRRACARQDLPLPPGTDQGRLARADPGRAAGERNRRTRNSVPASSSCVWSPVARFWTAAA